MGPLQKIAHNVAQGHFKCLPKDIMAVPALRDLVIMEVMNLLKKECAAVTCTAFGSILRKTSLTSLKSFCWDDLVKEWRTSAPTLLKFLESASSVSLNEATSNDTSEAKTKKRVATMAGAMMLQARSRRMCAPMFRNSLLLRDAGATKRCFQRFRTQGLCVSYGQTLKKLKEMGQTYDKELLDWKKACEEPEDTDVWIDIEDSEDAGKEDGTITTSPLPHQTPLPGLRTSSADLQVLL